MVEWKKLGEVCEIITGGDAPSNCIKGQLSPSLSHPYPVYSNGDGVYGFSPQYRVGKEAVSISSIGNVGSVFYREKNFTPIIRLKVVIPKYDFIKTKYLYYTLLGVKFIGTNSSLSSMKAADIKKQIIPIPSLKEQNRIVGILDTFTDSIENLKQQIAQRRKQYAYLIDNFFGGSLSEMKKKAEKGTLHIEPLSAHGTFTRGKRFVRTDVVEEGQPCIHYGDMYTYYGLYADKANTHLPYDFPKKMRYAKKGDVVIVGAGENNEDIAVGLVWLGDEPAAVHDACYIYESDFEPMYLSYFLRSSIYHLQIKSHVVRGKICSISSDGIGKALIPIFPKEKQKEIVSKLLPFESLLKNLEAQLAQRQKQYEYYRNQLLTFE